MIHKAKDNCLRLIFDEPELFAELLRDYVPIDMLKDISPADIEDMTEHFLPLFQDNRDADTVKRVNLKNNPPLFVIAILEHSSTVNYRTSFKMLQYITLVLAEYEKEANKENGNACFAKGFKYPPVLPLVFYDGTGKWTAETNFLNKTELNDVFHKYIPKFEYELVNLNDYSEEDLIRFGNMLSLIMMIDKFQKTDSEMGVFSKLPPDYMEKLQLEIPMHLRKLLSDVVTVLLKRVNITDEEINEITEKIQGGRLQEMFAGWDNYDVQETRRIAREQGLQEGRQEGLQVGREQGLQVGREEGRAEGEKETLRQMVIEMKKKDFSDDVIADITKLPIEKIKEI